MFRLKKIFVVIIGLLILTLLISSININSKTNIQNNNQNTNLELSNSLEGAENVLITEIIRNVNISRYGLVHIEDILIVLNKNNNPITSISIGIPKEKFSDLLYIQAKDSGEESLLTERANFEINDFRMVIIYFDTPLLYQQETTIFIMQTYNYLISFETSGSEQNINLTSFVFPILPYKANGENIKTIIRTPQESTIIEFEKIDTMGGEISPGILLYDLASSLTIEYLEPFLVNLPDESKEITIIFQNIQYIKLEIETINRDINILPLGIIKIKEVLLIQNTGAVPIYNFDFKIPSHSKNLRVFDNIGNLAITTTESNSDHKSIEINLLRNRVGISPLSKFEFTVEYNLPFDDYISLNWFQQSFQIDLMITRYPFLGNNEFINIIIEGCGNLDFISSLPDAIIDSEGSKILIYNLNDVSPLESNLIQITFAIDLFDLLLRPMIIVIIITSISSFYVVFIKLSKKKEGVSIIERDVKVLNELREFCALFEEKNALMLEIRKAEENLKRKKVTKKAFSNISDKNSAKIEQIKREIIPFKKTLMESNEIFNNIINKLDLMDAERISVNDSLTLLENRYKRGKLESKAVYQKLLEDFMKRRKRIDRTIDKFIQQLRSYLL
ncbi:MAG: hypothetical protein ACFFEO_03330 [Candidatus Thorarchaeota archaeon]